MFWEEKEPKVYQLSNSKLSYFRIFNTIVGLDFRLKHTGKSLSEVLIFASTNPQYDDRLFMKIASSEHVVHINCSECQKNPICVHNMF